MATKAQRDGVYRLGKGQFKIRAGDLLPEGAEMVEAKSQGGAPENKAKGKAPENKAGANQQDNG